MTRLVRVVYPLNNAPSSESREQEHDKTAYSVQASWKTPKTCRRDLNTLLEDSKDSDRPAQMRGTLRLPIQYIMFLTPHLIGLRIGHHGEANTSKFNGGQPFDRVGFPRYAVGRDGCITMLGSKVIFHAPSRQKATASSIKRTRELKGACQTQMNAGLSCLHASHRERGHKLGVLIRHSYIVDFICKYYDNPGTIRFLLSASQVGWGLYTNWSFIYITIEDPLSLRDKTGLYSIVLGVNGDKIEKEIEKGRREGEIEGSK
ncbi:hypothetical protein DFH09DRAFT_1099684 [Mycena vulgaris]|nr:hypothetical protein DFH09DRAFT_1099684 [Mycena vulgaris]